MYASTLLPSSISCTTHTAISSGVDIVLDVLDISRPVEIQTKVNNAIDTNMQMRSTNEIIQEVDFIVIQKVELPNINVQMQFSISIDLEVSSAVNNNAELPNTCRQVKSQVLPETKLVYLGN